MAPYFNKRFVCRCTLATVTVLIISSWINDKQNRVWLMGTRKPPKITSERHAHIKRQSRQEAKEPMKCNLIKAAVPCQTPPFMVDLCVPPPPVISYAFNSKPWYSNITMVTGYFNLGSFQKGDNQFFTNDLFKRWMSKLGKIRNFMVIFVEDHTTVTLVKKVRSTLPSYFTKIIRLKRSSLWAFKIENTIRKIYESPCYPKFHPNTVLASYSCVMHAKYDLIRTAVQENYFRTKYFSWVDVGYFRDEPEDGPPFLLGLPKDFNEESVAYTEIYSRQAQINCKEIVFKNLVWLGGGYFIGRGDVMLAWVMQYQSHVYNMLRSGLMSTDQQVIYCMFNANPYPSGVKIQVYKAQRKYHDWFTLGYLSKKKETGHL